MSDLEYYLSKVLLPRLQKLDFDLQRCIGKHRSRVERILATGIVSGSVVSFGCGNGSETLALAHILGAREVIGIDKDSALVEQAERSVVYNLLRPIQKGINKVKNILHGSPTDLKVSDAVLSNLVQLLHRYEGLCLPVHQVGDITKGEASTNLLSGHFDLAYCHYLLYHIYCTEDRPAVEDMTSAVREMARVVRPGGLVIAIEPDTCSEDDKTPVELRPFFERVGLQPVDKDKWKNLTDLGYVYRKAA